MQKPSFSPEDIHLNQQSFLSQSQIEKLKGHIFFSKNKNAKLWVPLLFIILITVVTDRNSWDALPYIIIFMSLYPLAHFIQIHWRIKKLIEGKIPVLSLRGVVETFYDEDLVKILPGRGGSQAARMLSMSMKFANINSADFCYCIKIADRRFYVDEPTYGFFENGKEYIIYYIKTINISPETVIPRGTIAGAIIVSAQSI